MCASNRPSMVAVLLTGVIATTTIGTAHRSAGTEAAGPGLQRLRAVGRRVTGDSLTPVMVSGLGNGVTMVAAGGLHSLAIQNGAVSAGATTPTARSATEQRPTASHPCPSAGFPAGSIRPT